VLLTVFLALLSPAGIHSIYAQDASYPVMDPSDADEEKEGAYTSTDADPFLNNKVHVQNLKDSILTRSVPTRGSKAQSQKNSAKPSSQEDDSILSFNFLYYLFEKYKMQDIVD
jgi:hypothetical protein